MTPPAAAQGASTLSIVGGVAFTVFWLVGSVVWGAMMTMGAAMANDSGRLSPERHATLLVVMVTGIAVAALAVVPGALAFFWSGHRHSMVWLAAGVFLCGVALQGWSFWSFFR